MIHGQYQEYWFMVNTKYNVNTKNNVNTRE